MRCMITASSISVWPVVAKRGNPPLLAAVIYVMMSFITRNNVKPRHVYYHRPLPLPKGKVGSSNLPWDTI